MASKKPNTFPLISVLTGLEELYTQTNGINGKFLINQVCLFILKKISGNGGITYNDVTGDIKVKTDDVSIGIIPSGDTGEVTVLTNGIKDYHIDWGTGTTKVNAEDVPVRDMAGNFSGATVEAVLAEVNSLIAPLDLGATLVIGNSTDGTDVVMSSGDVIKAASGGSIIDMRFFGVDNNLFIANDVGITKANIGMTNTAYQSAFGTDLYHEITADVNLLNAQVPTFFTAQAGFVGLRKNTTYGSVADFPLVIVENETGDRAVDAGGGAVFISTGRAGLTEPSISKMDVVRSPIVGGKGITAKTDDTLYTNQVSLQESGVLFDTIIAPPTATADRLQTLQDASGTIALTSDITDKEFDTNVALVAGVPLAVVHGLGSLKVHVQLWTGAGAIPVVTLVRTDANTITITSAGGEASVDVLVFKHS